MSHVLSWSSSAGPGALVRRLAARASHARALLAAVTLSFTYLGIAAPARLDSPVCAVRSGQRRRDLDPAPPDRRAPASRQGPQPGLGRPGDLVRADPAAPATAPQPASPDRLAAYAAALACSHRRAPP